jgi:hypothetical protein
MRERQPASSVRMPLCDVDASARVHSGARLDLSAHTRADCIVLQQIRPLIAHATHTQPPLLADPFVVAPSSFASSSLTGVPASFVSPSIASRDE